MRIVKKLEFPKYAIEELNGIDCEKLSDSEKVLEELNDVECEKLSDSK
jgi:hypothetical protein